MLPAAQRQHLELERALRAGDLAGVRAAFAGDSAFPNVHDPQTWTHLLALAISWAPLPLVRALLELGADPNFAAQDGFPAVYGALSTTRADRLDLAALLLTAGADPNARGINDYTPLHLAVSQRDLPATALLLAHGADAAARTRIDRCATPLEEAEALGNQEGADMLRAAIITKSSRPGPSAADILSLDMPTEKPQP